MKNYTPPSPALIEARRSFREASAALGVYSRQEARSWDIARINDHIEQMQAAVAYFKETGEK